eukprot:gene20231-24222_t
MRHCTQLAHINPYRDNSFGPFLQLHSRNITQAAPAPEEEEHVESEEDSESGSQDTDSEEEDEDSDDSGSMDSDEEAALCPRPTTNLMNAALLKNYQRGGSQSTSTPNATPSSSELPGGAIVGDTELKTPFASIEKVAAMAKLRLREEKEAKLAGKGNASPSGVPGWSPLTMRAEGGNANDEAAKGEPAGRSHEQHTEPEAAAPEPSAGRKGKDDGKNAAFTAQRHSSKKGKKAAALRTGLKRKRGDDSGSGGGPRGGRDAEDSEGRGVKATVPKGMRFADLGGIEPILQAIEITQMGGAETRNLWVGESREMERRIVAQLLTCMDDLNGSATSKESEGEEGEGSENAQRRGHVVVIGATNRPDSIDPALRRAGRFDREITLGVPDEAARARILKVLTVKLRLDGDLDLLKIGRPELVVGLAPLDGWMAEIVMFPLTHPEVYSWMGVEPPRGVLLNGPPGCGKTTLAHAIAAEAGVAYFSISAPEVVSGMSGESEAKLRSLFSAAAKAAPALIFIDEIDAITPKRENAQ